MFGILQGRPKKERTDPTGKTIGEGAYNVQMDFDYSGTIEQDEYDRCQSVIGVGVRGCIEILKCREQVSSAGIPRPDGAEDLLGHLKSIDPCLLADWRRENDPQYSRIDTMHIDGANPPDDDHD